MSENQFPYWYLSQYSISIVVPVYNEGQKIVENLKLLKTELEKYFNNFEIIVIDDGSTDDTPKNLSEFKGANFNYISKKTNQGKGAAVREGFLNAQGDFILFIDGGMELHPKEIKIFLGLMFLYEADIVIGSKRHPQSQVYYPWYRRLLSLMYQQLVRILFKVNVTDTQVGIKMFRREVIQDILPYLKIDHYGFDLEILSLAVVFGYKNIMEAPVRLDYFLKNNRHFTIDIIHTLRVGLLLIKDTFKLYRDIKNIQMTYNLAKDSKK